MERICAKIFVSKITLCTGVIENQFWSLNNYKTEALAAELLEPVLFFFFVEQHAVVSQMDFINSLSFCIFVIEPGIFQNIKQLKNPQT